MGDVKLFYPGVTGGPTTIVEPDGSVTEVVLSNTSFRQEFCEKVIMFFNKHHEEYDTKQVATPGGAVNIRQKKGGRLPTFAGFAASIGVSTSTLDRWENDFPEFKAACDVARAMQADMLLQNGLQGHYNPAVSIFAAKNLLGWRDKQPDENNATITHRFLMVPKKDPIGAAATTTPRIIDAVGPDSEAE